MLGLVLPALRYMDRSDVAHQAIRIWLRLYGAAIYEYHANTGQWPSRADDLARTSLPQRFPYWRQGVDDQAIVLVWHKDLAPDPDANAGRILAYHNKGLYARLGRIWVCRGDLRTEYIPEEDLRARLRAGQD
jgi:hypothetical protein